MGDDTPKPWEGPGVGYAGNKIHPVSKVLTLLQEEMVPEDLVTFTNLLKVCVFNIRMAVIQKKKSNSKTPVVFVTLKGRILLKG